MPKVLICDDSNFIRRALRSIIEAEPSLTLVGEAKNGREAVEMAASLKPDVITLDIEMPEMDGLTALKRIMANSPTNVIMLSSLTTEGSLAALSAMRDGAADFLAKSTSHAISLNELKEELVSKLKALGNSRRPAPRSAAANQSIPKVKPADFDLITIGSSTGGPPILEQILSAVNPGGSAPIVVAQHMPELFTRSMAQRLATTCQVPVRHLEDGLPLEPGAIHICPGGQNTHLTLRGRRFVAKVNREPESTIYYPSVNVLFSTASSTAGRRTLAIVLTGMGDDGRKGATELHAAGGKIFAQDADSCVVYGMPKAVNEAAIVSASLNPEALSQLLAAATGSTAAAANAA